MGKNDMWVTSVADLVLEGRNKYGSWDDDVSDMADALDGREPRKRNDPRGGFGVSHTDSVDEDFMREAGNSRNKYGI